MSKAYQVALSFAGEQRNYVEAVARFLQRRGIRLFYDRFETISLWGQNGVEIFHDVFAVQSAVVVMFISEAYVNKAWPRHERRSTFARMVRETGEYVLPVRFDDTPVPGLPDDVIFLRATELQPAELANLIAQKVGIAPYQGKASDVPPPRMVSLTGEPVFDYSSYDGRYVIGRDSMEFETAWSKADDTAIYIYNDPVTINGVAVPRDCHSVTQVRNAESLDYTSRARSVNRGAVAVLRNSSGFYAAVHVLEIMDDTRGHPKDELRFRYAIQSNGSGDFAEFRDLDS